MELVGGGWVVQSKFSVQLRPKLSNKQTRAIVKLFLRVTLTPVLASHWILRIVLANQRPPLPLVARNIQPVSLSKITLQRPFIPVTSILRKPKEINDFLKRKIFTVPRVMMKRLHSEAQISAK